MYRKNDLPLGPRMDDTSVGLSLAQLADRARMPTPLEPPRPNSGINARRKRVRKARADNNPDPTKVHTSSDAPPQTCGYPHPNTPPRTPPPYHPPTRKRRWTPPHRSRSPSQPDRNLKSPSTPRKCKSTPTPRNLRALPPRRKRKHARKRNPPATEQTPKITPKRA